MEAKDKLRELKRLIEIRNELRRIYELWSKKKSVRSLIKNKLEDKGEVAIDDLEILGRFRSTEEAMHFFELYATAYGCSFEERILKGVHELGDESGTGGKEGPSDVITKEEKECVEDIVIKKAIIGVQDVIGCFEGDAMDEIKDIFKEIEESHENFMMVDNLEAIINLKLIMKNFKVHIMRHKELDDRAYKEYIARKSKERMYKDFSEFLNTLNKREILSGDNIYTIINIIKGNG